MAKLLVQVWNEHLLPGLHTCPPAAWPHPALLPSPGACELPLLVLYNHPGSEPGRGVAASPVAG